MRFHVQLHARESLELRCAICHDGLSAPGSACQACGTRFHADCWVLVHRCPSLGCDDTPRFADDDPPRRGRLTIVTVLIALGLVAICAAILAPNLLVRRRLPCYEGRALQMLHTLMTSEAIFREGDKEGDGNLDYGMLSELNDTKLIDSVLGSGTRAGYLFQASYSRTTSEFLWFAVANPTLPGTTGDRYFATNQAGVIYYTSTAAVSMDTSTCVLPQQGLVPTGK